MIGKEKREGWILATAQYNAAPNETYLRGMEAIADKYDYQIGFIMVAGAPYEKEENIHPRLQEHHIITKNFKINDSLEINNYKVKPQKIKPLTGLRRFTKKNKSSIFGSPKQSWEHMPSKKDNPKLIATTGAITKPHYNLNTETGVKAELMHEYGALVVDVIDDTFFQWSNILATKNGKFNFYPYGHWDGTKLYKPKPLKALNMGDAHYIKASEDAHQWTQEIIKKVKPQLITDHDIGDFGCISHHNVGKVVSSYFARKNTLHEEFVAIKEHMMDIYKSLPKGAKYYVPAANHNEHLMQWVNEGRFVLDAENSELGNIAHAYMLQNKNPLEMILKEHYGLPKNIKFLTRNDELKTHKIELADHFDKGPSGTRFSVTNAIQNKGLASGGHGHTSYKHEGITSAGTRSEKRLGYNVGDSSWSHSMMGVDLYGKQQVFNYIIM